MKIALIITGLGMGGAERQVCDLADQFAAKGHKVLLVSLTGETVNRPQSNDVAVVELNMDKKLIGFIKAYWQAIKTIKAFKPDVVHSHMVHANIFTRLLRVMAPMPKLICTAHSSNEGGRARMLAYRLTDHLCELNTNVSQKAADISVERGATAANRIIAMHNGIDTGRFVFNAASRNQLRNEIGLHDATPLILAVGRLTLAKDYPNLLRAFQRLTEAGKMAQLVIVGTGEEESMLTSLVAELGLCEQVNFLGLRHDVHEWMSAADLFVLSSAWEGFGLVVAEAMACERVVVATDCGGVKEIVGTSGILVPTKNSEALAIGLIKGLSLPPLVAKQLGIQARERIVQNFSLDVVSEKWLALYKQ